MLSWLLVVVVVVVIPGYVCGFDCSAALKSMLLRSGPYVVVVLLVPGRVIAVVTILSSIS